MRISSTNMPEVQSLTEISHPAETTSNGTLWFEDVWLCSVRNAKTSLDQAQGYRTTIYVDQVQAYHTTISVDQVRGCHATMVLTMHRSCTPRYLESCPASNRSADPTSYEQTISHLESIRTHSLISNRP